MNRFKFSTAANLSETLEYKTFVINYFSLAALCDLCDQISTHHFAHSTVFTDLTVFLFLPKAITVCYHPPTHTDAVTGVTHTNVCYVKSVA